MNANKMMSRIFRTGLVALAGLVLVGALSTTPASAGVSFDFFYSNLSPHGHWLVSANFGRVWQPQVYRPGWNPYYDGRWAYTDVGYTWVSDYSWGDVPYHYGTWTFDPAYGWVWVPGYTWAPAWVVFRQGPDYIGWAPVTPSFSVGISITPSCYDPHFVFVPAREFVGVPVRRYAVPVSQTNVIINRTRIVNRNLVVENNVVVNRGLDPGVIERASGRRLRPVPLERTGVISRSVRRDALRVEPGVARSGHLMAAVPERSDRRDRAQRFDQAGRFNGAGARGGHETIGRAPERRLPPADHPSRTFDRQVAPQRRDAARQPDHPRHGDAMIRNGRTGEGSGVVTGQAQDQRRGRNAAGHDQANGRNGNGHDQGNGRVRDSAERGKQQEKARHNPEN